MASRSTSRVVRRLALTSNTRASSRFFSSNSAPAPTPFSHRPTTTTIAAFSALGLGLGLWQGSTVSLDATTEWTAAEEPRSKSEILSRESEDETHEADALPRYRIAEVRKHGATSERPWVIYKNKVYDITDWIPGHPGGQVILRAAGGSIDPYWDIFTIHKAQYVYDILDQYLIGSIDPLDLVDGLPPQDQIEDPFSSDPARHPDLATLTAKPRNAETPGSAVDGSFLTPNDLFYVRNHMWVPKLDHDADKHALKIELYDGTTKDYTLHDLKTKFPRRTVTAALQCSGNRRNDMSEGSGRKANGLPWKTGAISNATWSGVSLADVLRDAGYDIAGGMSGDSEVKHVHFSGLEAYGASIPIKKAIDPQGDVILAFSMNGKPLPRDHGFPLRAIVPGHVAARSVKWLSGITLSDEESTSQWQRRDYKCFGPNETNVDWDAAPAIQELPVQSAITGTKLGSWKGSGTDGPTRQVALTGYAYSGGGRAIIRVDVSLDNGATWKQAELLQDCIVKDGADFPCVGNAAWSWMRWKFLGDVTPTAFVASSQDKNQRCTTAIVKATDEAYNTQPESHAATWNVRGNLATAWHRVQICSECSPKE